ncbi:hypothetical protein F8388_011887 [Cannabis sativa]|uniref:Zinc knuckle CX2CX4HX4C domain-containing protein n=1 Tax=Cannabis sativa TaxID=3483 RepID=A0A7J6GDD3_CANSA|nr:hypothetical protein G4B88_011520 [Cannabis sativa]KAF4380965.1 hypothetical protein F8388_011887 [Cannabis sativa]
MASASSRNYSEEIGEEVILEIEEFGGLSLEVEEEEEEYDVRWCLVGQDIKRVIDGSPWTFERKQLIFERLKVGDNLRTIILNRLDLWVQIHDLQHGFRTERTLQKLGDYIRKFVESDENNFSGVWREYFKVCVTINLDQPIKRRMKIRRLDSSDWFWVNFKYEHAPTFSFICGLIGHADKLFPQLFETSKENIVKPYGVFMRATTQRQNKLIGGQWLRSGRKERQGEEQSTPVRREEGESAGRKAKGVQVHASGGHGVNRGGGENHGIDEAIMVQKISPEFEENGVYNIDINMSHNGESDMQALTCEELTVQELKRKRMEKVGSAGLGKVGQNLNVISESVWRGSSFLGKRDNWEFSSTNL